MPLDTDILPTLARTVSAVPVAGLASTAYVDLLTFFPTIGHAPSGEQWAAIRDLLDHLELAANGALPHALHVSAIPAGTGKSASIAAFARALMDSPDRDGVGMLILVNRKTEAKDMAEALKRHRDKVCVITSDPAVNALGGQGEANLAQVCIATQAALKLTLRHLQDASFDAASRFHYRGERRAVIAWDESFAFNRPVTLDADTVLGLMPAMRRQSRDAASTLLRWSCDLETRVGGRVSVPNFEDLGVNFSRLEDDVGDRDELVTQVKALAVISGDEGYVAAGSWGGSALVTHYPEIPRSLMPVIVTDASAKVNPSYTAMRKRVSLRWLKDANKTYHNLTLRLVPAAASRSVYRDHKTTRGRDLLDMAVRYIESVPGEDVLVIGYKGRFNVRGVDDAMLTGDERTKLRGTLEGALRSRLKSADWGRVHYLTYGRHTATNDYRDIRRVVLLGLNFIPTAAGHAASGAALDLNLIDQHPTADQISEMRTGMVMDATLQALLRGSARMGVGGDCGVMEAVIPQTKQTGLSRADYQRMFPGANLVNDTVLMPKKPLKGRLSDLAAIIRRRLEAGETEMTNESLYAELRMAKGNFGKLVKQPAWQAFVQAVGLNPQRLPGRRMGLRLVSAG